MALTEDMVTFTVLEDGMYLPSVGAVLPEGTYVGRITREDGALRHVALVIPLRVLAELGLKGANTYSITGDYRSGLIVEDRVP